MMLTDSEREWLEYRDIANPRGTYFCEYCKNYVECHSDMLWGIDECPTAPLSLQDAAEFEARVAAKLADPYYPPMDAGSDGPQLFMPPADRLKWARIEVEEEMDG